MRLVKIVFLPCPGERRRGEESEKSEGKEQRKEDVKEE